MPCCIFCCLPASQIVLKRLRRVSAIWCSSAKRKAKQWFKRVPVARGKWFRWKITPGLNSSWNSKQRCRSSMSIRSIRKFSHKSFTSDAFYLLLDWLPNVETAVDPFTDCIVCRVTKISSVRVASGLQSTNKPVSSRGPLERSCQDCICFIKCLKCPNNDELTRRKRFKTAWNAGKQQ